MCCGPTKVQQRHALDLVERLEPEHLQVGVVGADVHALVDVGDRVARGGDQRVAAALGLAQLRLEPAQPAARLQVCPFAADRLQQVFGAVLEHQRARAAAEAGEHGGLVDPVDQLQQRQVLAAGGDLGADLVQRHRRRIRRHRQVDRLAGDHLRQFGRILRTQGAYRDAAVAQGTDDRFGVFHAVVDDEQADRCVFLHAEGRNLREMGASGECARGQPV